MERHFVVDMTLSKKPSNMYNKYIFHNPCYLGILDEEIHSYESTKLHLIKECSDISTTMITFTSLPYFMSLCVLHIF